MVPLAKVNDWRTVTFMILNEIAENRPCFCDASFFMRNFFYVQTSMSAPANFPTALAPLMAATIQLFCVSTDLDHMNANANTSLELTTETVNEESVSIFVSMNSAAKSHDLNLPASLFRLRSWTLPLPIWFSMLQTGWILQRCTRLSWWLFWWKDVLLQF